jgi:hypothetical protein
MPPKVAKIEYRWGYWEWFDRRKGMVREMKDVLGQRILQADNRASSAL